MSHWLEEIIDDWQPEQFYAQITLVTVDQTPLLARPQLARQVAAALSACIPEAPGRLWGYVVLPNAIRLVVGPTDEDALEMFVDMIRARTHTQILDAILRADDDSLDDVLRYNPVWGGAIYQVWQAGGHRQIFATEYKLSSVIYELRQAPVMAGLVTASEAWPYLYLGDQVS